MALSIKDPETDSLARELSRTTGESLTEAIRRALAERLARERARRAVGGLAATVVRIQDSVAVLTVRDARTADDLLGYDRSGVPS